MFWIDRWSGICPSFWHVQVFKRFVRKEPPSCHINTNTPFVLLVARNLCKASRWVALHLFWAWCSMVACVTACWDHWREAVLLQGARTKRGTCISLSLLFLVHMWPAGKFTVYPMTAMNVSRTVKLRQAMRTCYYCY